ncbi:MAG: hypothetical protein GF313_11365 [Caldithrix sp.]|nr:hypothetical protein [Caldithrix sp.]
MISGSQSKSHEVYPDVFYRELEGLSRRDSFGVTRSWEGGMLSILPCSLPARMWVWEIIP